LIVPQPVTTPSPRGLDFSIPKSTQRWVTNMSYSSKLPSSSRTVDPLPRGQLALGVLAVDALLPAAKPRLAAPLSSCSRMSFMAMSLPSRPGIRSGHGGICVTRAAPAGPVFPAPP
jgi:hypothetical protein